MTRNALPLLAVAGLLALNSGVMAGQHPLLDALQPYCQQAFAGRLVSADAADATMQGLPLVVHLQYCRPDEMRLAFHVGADASRTWVLRRLPAGLQLKHEHMHDDGSPDELTRYGGLSAQLATTTAVPLLIDFPADGYSQQLFIALGRHAATENVWRFGWQPGQLTYSLRRDGRYFAVQFDFSQPVALPIVAWGAPGWADLRQQ
jgi:hypothetical protein